MSLRLVTFNDVYNLHNLPKVQTLLSKIQPHAVILAGDFLSPSTLSALDGGKGMVATLRAVGVTHAILGNHEADLRLPILQKRLTEFRKSTKLINSNVGRSTKKSWLTQIMDDYCVIDNRNENDNARVALMGLLSDEQAVFRDLKFRGIPIDSVTESYDRVYQRLVQQYQQQNSSSVGSSLIPVTHQSIARDRQLAEQILSSNSAAGRKGIHLIIGGHEHKPIDETIRSQDDSGSYVRIIKTGCEAENVSLIDLQIDPQYGITDMHIDLIDTSTYDSSVFVQQIVDSHHSLLDALDNEPVVQDADKLLPPGTPLSSENTRYKQTSVGGLFCTAIKEELECDVAIMNGAPIKGNKTYTNASMSYAELKNELPFPCKMVVVPIKRFELQNAIHYSRTCPTEPGQEPGLKDVMRRGFLQVDIQFDLLGFHTGGQDDELRVALPRNLMKGFCDIKPLMAVGEKLESQGLLPDNDDFIPAINVIIRHFCKERWYDIVRDNYSFGDLDMGHKGYLSRNDVKRMLRKALGHNPADFVVDDMVAAIDADENGIVDPGEFSHFLASMERGTVRFE